MFLPYVKKMEKVKGFLKRRLLLNRNVDSETK